jgi:hypothetical protein
MNKNCSNCNGDGTKDVYDHHQQVIIVVKCDCKEDNKEKAA